VRDIITDPRARQSVRGPRVHALDAADVRRVPIASIDTAVSILSSVVAPITTALRNDLSTVLTMIASAASAVDGADHLRDALRISHAALSVPQCVCAPRQCRPQ